MNEKNRRISKFLTKVRNRFYGFLFAIYYRILKPVYFKKLGRSFYCHGFIRFKHLAADISVASGVYFGPRMTLDVCPEGRLKIGAGTAFTGDTVISSASCVEIGENCLFSEFVSVRDANHGMARNAIMASQPMNAEPIKIGDDVWIGRGVVILKGTVIGAGAVIGANSVVRGVIPPYSIAAGAPAVVIKERK